MRDPDLTIERQEHWGRFAENGLEAVVDPMVFRTADLFLRGQRGAQRLGLDADKVWQSIRANVGALATFFDRFILEPRLPLIDYGTTFDSNVGYERTTLLDFCNEAAGEKVVLDVQVMEDAYVAAKDLALRFLEQAGDPDPLVCREVLGEMADFDYRWRPDLGYFQVEDENDQKITTFLFGGHLFGVYAQATGAVHVLQPNRAALYLETSLNRPAGGADRDQVLLDEFGKILDSKPHAAAFLQMKGMPLFLPHLLYQDPAGPLDLLRMAAKLRSEAAVQELRGWQSAVLGTWKTRGRIDPATQRKLRGIAARVTDAVAPRKIPGEMGIGLAGVTASAKVDLDNLVGWFDGLIPGRRHAKLLQRLFVSANAYRAMEIDLERLWRQNP